MTLYDDLRQPLTKKELDRRKLLGLAGSGALLAAACGTCIAGIRYLEPSVLFEEDPRVQIGHPESIAPGQVIALPKKKLYVVRNDEGIYALSSICTHLGCMTRFDATGPGFACPCHGSRFGIDGHVAAGPAPRPLSRVLVVVERGSLVVDTSKTAAPDSILKVT
jgi:cytochrome b6-f complex iron-sulfur subunit